MNTWKPIILGILIGIAIVASSFILAGGFGTIAKPDRTVTVRGLAEREVAADLAVWQMRFSLGGDDLKEVQKNIIDKTALATAYLKKNGLEESDYKVQAPDITDTSLQIYNSDKAKYRYIAKQDILVRSHNIKAVQNAQEHSLELLSDDITVLKEYDNGINYEYTALNSIKPEMIGEATKNARSAAEQFANDSGSKVGKIKNATQGYFSIDSAATGLEDMKKIRVVTTIEYTLSD
ncbi:MAG: SIMPL domain-containing protein [Proteobacteria bacterium]|nr:SIMPL domain-containing protein [Pseudomonadota bacterium]